MSYSRWRDQRWIAWKYGRNAALTTGFGVTYYGAITSLGQPKGTTGFLVLLKDRLVFKSRKAKIEFEISSEAIKNVYHATEFKGKQMYQSIVSVDFVNQSGKADTVAFRLPYPPQWIRIIRVAFNLPDVSS